MDYLKKLRVALEIVRAHSHASAVNIDPRMVGVQRGRKRGTDHLDWACDFLAPFRQLERSRRLLLTMWAMRAGGEIWSEATMREAENALRWCQHRTCDKLMERGDRIAARY